MTPPERSIEQSTLAISPGLQDVESLTADPARLERLLTYRTILGECACSLADTVYFASHELEPQNAVLEVATQMLDFFAVDPTYLDNPTHRLFFLAIADEWCRLSYAADTPDRALVSHDYDEWGALSPGEQKRHLLVSDYEKGPNHEKRALLDLCHIALIECQDRDGPVTASGRLSQAAAETRAVMDELSAPSYEMIDGILMCIERHQDRQLSRAEWIRFLPKGGILAVLAKNDNTTPPPEVIVLDIDADELRRETTTRDIVGGSACYVDRTVVLASDYSRHDAVHELAHAFYPTFRWGFACLFGEIWDEVLAEAATAHPTAYYHEHLLVSRFLADDTASGALESYLLHASPKALQDFYTRVVNMVGLRGFLALTRTVVGSNNEPPAWAYDIRKTAEVLIDNSCILAACSSEDRPVQ
jgi:hypothetical protein